MSLSMKRDANNHRLIAQGLEMRLASTGGVDQRVQMLRWTKEERDLANRPKSKLVGLYMRALAWMK